jgi:hypothetical protein
MGKNANADTAVGKNAAADACTDTIKKADLADGSGFTRLGIRIRKDITGSFGSCCLSAGIDPEDEIARLMASCCGMGIDTPRLIRVDTFKGRRKALGAIVACLEKISMVEQWYADGIPRVSHYAGEAIAAIEFIDRIDEAAEIIREAY